jgi:hypothetical protein
MTVASMRRRWSECRRAAHREAGVSGVQRPYPKNVSGPVPGGYAVDENGIAPGALRSQPHDFMLVVGIVLAVVAVFAGIALWRLSRP